MGRDARIRQDQTRPIWQGRMDLFIKLSKLGECAILVVRVPFRQGCLWRDKNCGEYVHQKTLLYGFHGHASGEGVLHKRAGTFLLVCSELTENVRQGHFHAATLLFHFGHEAGPIDDRAHFPHQLEFVAHRRQLQGPQLGVT